MLEQTLKKLKYAMSSQQNERNDDGYGSLPVELYETLDENLQMVGEAMGGSKDIIVRKFSLAANNKKCALVFIDGLVNQTVINKNIVEPLMYKSRLFTDKNDKDSFSIEKIQESMVAVGEVTTVSNFTNVIDGCLSGDTVLLIDGYKQALVINSKGWEKRSIEDPASETVIRGPREAFTESINNNSALLRVKIKNPALTFESMKIGKRTRTSVKIAYMRGIANQELIDKIKKRLQSIQTDAILESGYIEQYIEDAPFSIFSTISYSEKPDVIAAKILEGRVAILVDGTPFVLTAPMLFIESFQTAEDYYNRPLYASLMRILRYFCYALSIFTPAVFVALLTFHQEMIPTPLLFTISAAREGVPFPAIMETGIMAVTFEILREAGLRLPRAVGQAVSIVGALVMGEAAVSAGIVSEPVVIVIALTGVAGFAVPSQADSGTILRFIFLLLGGTMGGFGIAMGILGTMVHLASLKSFGSPFLSPLAPLQVSDTKDTIIRAPVWTMITRPKSISKNKSVRQKFNVPPAVSSEDDDITSGDN